MDALEGMCPRFKSVRRDQFSHSISRYLATAASFRTAVFRSSEAIMR